MAVLVAALMAIAPPDGETLPRPPVREGVAASPAPSSIHRNAVRRRPLPRPDLSMIADPYRSEPSYAPRKIDPQHPLLAPPPDELDEADEGLVRVTPVPRDPWAPAVQPDESSGDGVRPYGSAR